MPDEDLYDSGASESMAAPKPEAEKPKEDEGRKTYLVPSEICPGMKPGEEMVVTIEAVHDDQYTISYAPEKGSEEKGEGEKEMAEPSNPGAGGSGEMSSLYS